MGKSVLKEFGTSTIGQMYQKHYGRVTAPRRILVYLAEWITEQEDRFEALGSKLSALETELEKIQKMLSAKSDQATAHTRNKRTA
jgi:Tfp pilus assembly protein PilN